MERTLGATGKAIWELFVATGRELVRRVLAMRAGAIVFLFGYAVLLVFAIVYRQPLQDVLGQGFPTPAPPTATFQITMVIDTFAGGAGMVVLGVASYVFGRATKRDAFVDFAIVLAVAGLWSFAFTRIGQIVLEDARPRHGGEMHWFGFDGHGVSGHASAASLLMTPARDVLARTSSRAKRSLIGAALFAWALFIGWSRVYLDQHHVWNVVLGLGVGFLCARAATSAFLSPRSVDAPAQRLILG